MQIGDKVKLKSAQDSALPGTLRDYLDRTGLSVDTAVFTVTSLGGRIDLAELDTRGGYYTTRFELAVTAAHQDDLDKLAAALLAEVTSRGGRWLDVYDTLVARISPQLTGKLPERVRPITLDLGPVLGTVTVQASSEAEAKQKVLDALTPLAS